MKKLVLIAFATVAITSISCRPERAQIETIDPYSIEYIDTTERLIIDDSIEQAKIDSAMMEDAKAIGK